MTRRLHVTMAARVLPFLAAGASAVCPLLEGMRSRWLWHHNRDFAQAEPFYLPKENAKHTPFIIATGAVARVTVGPPELRHPTEPDKPHYIDGIYVVDQSGAVVAAAELGPTAHPPVLEFDIPAGSATLTPFSHCNTHGLFRGDPFTVSAASPRPAVCGPTACLPDSAGLVDGVCQQHTAIVADVLRRNGGAEAVHDPAGQAKHTPVLTVSGARALLTVGLGTVSGDESQIHKQYDAGDPVKIHVIEAVYVLDQDNRVLAVGQIAPTADAARLEFDIPTGTTSLTPYEYCNVHGLFRGDTVSVTDQGQLVELSCGVTSCLSLPGARCPLLDSMLAEQQKRHELDYSSNVAFYQVAANPKHTPFIELAGSTARVIVGTPAIRHPMDPKAPHFIDTLYVTDQNGAVVAFTKLSPTAPAPAAFDFVVPAGAAVLVPFSHCNTHGLFRGPQAYAAAPGGDPAACAPTSCLADSARVDGRCEAFESYRADFERRHGAAAVHDPSGQAKHTPVLTIDGELARVTVGLGTAGGDKAAVHHQYDPLDPDKVHFIEALWAVDQDGAVVSLALLGAFDEPPTLVFRIPAGVTALVPYEFCNVHGLFRGDSVTVGTAGTAAAECAPSSCYHSGRGAGRCPILEAARAVMQRRHTTDFGGDPPAYYNRFDNGFYTPVENRKHTPYIAYTGNFATVTVGPPELRHPTDPAAPHYIDGLYVTDQSGAVIAASILAPTGPAPPTLVFEVPAGATALTPFSHCNQHGLFRGAEYPVPAAGDTVRGPVRCGLSACMANAAAASGADCPAFTSLRAEQLRRNAGPATYAPDTDPKHTPVAALTPTGGVRVTVGLGTVNGNDAQVHRQYSPTDPAAVHVIETLWLEDQDGTVIAMAEVSPLVDKAEAVFDLPAGVTTVTPFEYCNVHGLFRGAPLDVSGGVASHSVERECGVRLCWGAPGSGGHCPLMESIHAEQVRRQELDYKSTVPFFQVAANPKHTPFITITGTAARIVVGTAEIRHPTDPVAPHFIDTIYAVDQNDAVVAFTRLGATGTVPPVLDFAVPVGTTTLTPYEHCNKHGLFRGPVGHPVAAAGSLPLCAPAQCLADTTGRDAAGQCALFNSLRADVVRRQGGPAIHDVAGQAKHTPIATLVGGGARVRITVGVGSVSGDKSTAHRQYDPLDPLKSHFIETLYAEDQDGVVIALGQLSALDDPPAMEFAIPPGTTQVIPYEYCNVHGLFRGDALSVQPPAGTRQLQCEPTVCLPTGQRALQQYGGGGGAVLTMPPVATPVPGPPETPSPAKGCDTSDLHREQQNAENDEQDLQEETFSCMTETGGNSPSLHWTLNEEEGTVEFGVRAPGTGWIGISFPEESDSMVPADGVIAWAGGGGTHVNAYHLSQQNIRGVAESAEAREHIGWQWAGVEEVSSDKAFAGARRPRPLQAAAYTVLRFRRSLCNDADAPAGCVKVSITDPLNINVAFHPTADEILPHPVDRMASIRLALKGGTVEQVGLVDVKERNRQRRIHGAVMLAAWLYCAPLAVFFKRYGKPVLGIGMSTSRTYPAPGFFLHMGLALAAVGLSLYGLAAVAMEHWWTVGKIGKARHYHSEIGLTCFLLLCLQPAIGFLGLLVTPRYDHPLRWLFNLVHGWIGRGLLVLSIVQCFLGLRNMKDLYVDHLDLERLAIIGLSGHVALFAFGELMKQCYFVRNKGAKQWNEEGGQELSIPMSTVAQHVTDDDCWVSIDGRAYNVTPWLSTHPGGPTMITQFAGMDATEGFNSMRHSEQARKKLERYFIAKVESARVVNSVQLAEDVTSSLVILDLSNAQELVEEAVEVLEDIPHGLCDSFNKLIYNLRQYLPYLPQNLLTPEDDEYDSEGEQGEPVQQTPNGAVKQQNESPRSAAAPILPSSSSREEVQSPVSSFARSRGHDRHNSYVRRRSSLTSVASSALGADNTKILTGQKRMEEKLSTVLKWKSIALVAVNVHKFLEMIIHQEQGISRILAGYLQSCIDVAARLRGCVDSFNGDRIFVGFNTARIDSQHKLLACQFADGWIRKVHGATRPPHCMGTLTPRGAGPPHSPTTTTVTLPTGSCLSVAVVSCRSLCGNAGCDTMRKYSILGASYGWAATLERLSRHFKLSVPVCDDATAQGASAQADLRLLHLVQRASLGTKGTTRLWGIVSLIDAGEQEWMYQLDSAACSKLWTKYNRAMQAFLNGDGDTAVQQLQELKTPETNPAVTLAGDMLQKEILTLSPKAGTKRGLAGAQQGECTQPHLLLLLQDLHVSAAPVNGGCRPAFLDDIAIGSAVTFATAG